MKGLGLKKELSGCEIHLTNEAHMKNNKMFQSYQIFVFQKTHDIIF